MCDDDVHTSGPQVGCSSRPRQEVLPRASVRRRGPAPGSMFAVAVAVVAALATTLLAAAPAFAGREGRAADAAAAATRTRLAAPALPTAAPVARSTAGVECLIEPSHTVEVRTAVDGVIESVPVERGAFVRKGQLLVELQSSAERAVVETARFRAGMEGQIGVAQSRLDYAQRKARRVAEMVASQFASQQALDEADAERRLAENEWKAALEARALAQLDLRRAQEQLALRRVASPLSGIVLDRLLNPGDLSDAGSGRRPVLRLAAIDTLRVQVVLPAAKFGQVTVGQKAVVMAAVGGGRYESVVGQVDRAIDPASATFLARLDLPNPGHRVPVGARCTVMLAGGAELP